MLAREEGKPVKKCHKHQTKDKDKDKHQAKAKDKDKHQAKDKDNYKHQTKDKCVTRGVAKGKHITRPAMGEWEVLKKTRVNNSLTMNKSTRSPPPTLLGVIGCLPES